MQDHISMDQLLKRGDSLPTLPEIYFKVNELLEDKDSSVADICRTVATDPAISYKILTMVNSAYFGLPNEVFSINQAITMLGRFRIKQILIGTLLGDVFKDFNSEYFSLREFWQHSVRTAIIAEQLAIISDYCKEPESLFTAGLLHDVGRLIVAAKMPEVLPVIDQNAIDNRISIVRSEIEIIGLAHTEIGAALMQKWGFPELIWVSVNHHHKADYSGPFFQVTQLICLANQLAHCEPPADVEDMRQMLNTIENWQDADASVEYLFNTCQRAETLVYEVASSLGLNDGAGS